MRNQGLAHMGIGRAKGENRVIESVRQAVSSPLLETTIEGAKSVILNVTGGKDLMLSEVNEAAVLVQGIIDASANIIFGATIDESMIDEVKITVIATGFIPNNVEEVSIAKPSISVSTEETLPLLRAIENNIPKNDPEVVLEPKPVVEEQAVVTEPEPIEEPKQENKGRELPAFMRKLFGKK
jgi:cell division GTPase FtsZ